MSVEPITKLEITNVKTIPGKTNYTVYQIKVYGPVRSWEVDRRYSEFNSLNRDLNKMKQIPLAFPPKIIFPQEEDIKKRKIQLESYLIAILNHHDSVWRRSKEWKQFLDIPENPIVDYGKNQIKSFDPTKWLQEHESLVGFVYEIRSQKNARDHLVSRGNTSGAQNSNFQMRKGIKIAKEKLDLLTNSLDNGNIAPGELQRRKDLLANTANDLIQLEKQNVVRANDPSKEKSTEKNKLFEIPVGSFTRKAGIPTRIMETEQTRMLDNQQLLTMQDDQMKKQDEIITTITNVVKRQREIGMAISDELDAHANLLDQVKDKIEVVGSNMKAGEKKMKRIIDKS